jgi:hypothetical protein
MGVLGAEGTTAVGALGEDGEPIGALGNRNELVTAFFACFYHPPIVVSRP